MTPERITLTIQRSDIKDCKKPCLDEFTILDAKDPLSANYYHSFIAIIERLFCS
jgi:hypothetical protein